MYTHMYVPLGTREVGACPVRTRKKNVHPIHSSIHPFSADRPRGVPMRRFPLAPTPPTSTKGCWIQGASVNISRS